MLSTVCAVAFAASLVDPVEKCESEWRASTLRRCAGRTLARSCARHFRVSDFNPFSHMKSVEQTVLHWDGALHGADGPLHGADAAVHWAIFLAQTTCCFSAVWSFLFSLQFR